jgi:hypothetical protein
MIDKEIDREIIIIITERYYVSENSIERDRD